MAAAEKLLTAPGLEFIGEIGEQSHLMNRTLPVASGARAAYLDAGDQLVVIKLADASEIWRTQVPRKETLPFGAVEKLYYSGATVYLVEVASSSLLIHAFDTVTGQWKTSKPIATGTIPVIFGSYHEPRFDIRGDEIRVTLFGGESPSIVASWRRSTLTPLKTLKFGSGKNMNGPPFTWEIGVWFGERFCAGYTTTNNNGLVLEKNGQSSIRRFDMNASFRAGMSNPYLEHAVSDDYLAIRVSNRSRHPNGYLIWRTSDADPKPVFISTAGSKFTHFPFIINNRFLAVFETDWDDGFVRLMRIQDLTRPSLPPILINLPTATPKPQSVAVVGSDLYLISAPGFIEPHRRLLRLPGIVGSGPVGVRVNAARGTETGGLLRFRVEATMPPAAPFSVSFRSRSGSASEGSDFAPAVGSVVLTPAKPFADVDIAILPDAENEPTETMVLEVTHAGGAWVSNKLALGQIHQGGISFLRRAGRPPGATPSFRFEDWAMTEAGLVAGFGGPGGYSYHIFRHDRNSWQALASLSGLPFDPSFKPSILANAGNRIVVERRSSIGGKLLHTLVDVDGDAVIHDTDATGGAPILSNTALVGLSTAGPRLICRNLTTGEVNWQREPWETEYAYVDRLGTVDDLSFTHNLQDKVLRRSYSDGSLLEEIPTSIVGDMYPARGNGGYWMGTVPRNNGFIVIGNTRSGATYPATLVTVPEYETGMITGTGFGLFPSGVKSRPVNMIDCATGFRLDSFDEGDVHAMGTGGRWFGLANEDTISVFDTQPELPGLVHSSLVRREDDRSEWLVQLAAPAPSSMTVAARTAGNDVAAERPVEIPAGGVTFRMPARVVEDNLPEMQESATIWLDFTGGGKSASYRLTIVIPENQIMILPVPGKGQLLRKATAVDVHAKGVVVGSLLGNAAADPRYKKVYRGGGKFGFGESVASNGDFLAVGTVDLTYEYRTPPSVTVFKRKSGAKAFTLEGKSDGTAFGAVLHMDARRLYAGAPSTGRMGYVRMRELANGREQVCRDPSGKAGSGFGAAITSAGNHVWIGASNAKTTGRVYQFDARTGRKVREFSPPAGNARNFGISLEVLGTTLFVGAPGDAGIAAVFAYNINTGKLVHTIPSPFADGGNFGASLASLSATRLVVGCPSASFAPGGGVLVYDVSPSGCHLVTLLRPDTRPGSGGNAVRGMGMAGGLSGADGVLGVLVESKRDPLWILDTTNAYGRDSAVALYNLKKLLPVARALGHSGRTAGFQAIEPWRTALGESVSISDHAIRIGSSGGSPAVVLPPIVTVNPGTRVTLEWSGDLVNWSPAAVLDEKGNGEWRIPAGGQGQIADGLFVWPDEKRTGMYFRMKCETECPP